MSSGAPEFCVAGLGVTAQGRHLGIPPRALRREALELALADAGLTRRDVDGYIGTSSEPGFEDVRHLGLSPAFAWAMSAGGATATWSIINAMGAIRAGQAEVVACTYGAAPTSLPRGATGGRSGGYGAYGYGYPMMYGMVGAASAHALHAQRHMYRYGTTSAHLGAVAVAQHAHAALRPGSIGYGQPITLEEHQASPMIVEPFRLLDCCRDTDGGVVVIVTTAARASALRGKAVDILGVGTGQNLEIGGRVTSTTSTTTLLPPHARPSVRPG